MIGLATMSMIAWFVGAVSLVAAFSVDTRHERELRASADHTNCVTGTRRGQPGRG